MSHRVFNGTIAPNNLGSDRTFSVQEKDYLLAELFEQLMLFDKVVLKTDRTNYALRFLLSYLDINLVQTMIERGMIKFMIWTPVIVSGSGHEKEDGTVDVSRVMGTPPIATGSLSKSDTDIELNIKSALDPFRIHRDRRRIFTRRMKSAYLIPDGMEFSVKAAEFVTDAYSKNNLSGVGMPYNVRPEELDIDSRFSLLNIGSKVLESSVLAKHGLKSYFNDDHYKIFDANLRNIGSAYNVSENTSTIFNIEQIPDLKSLYLNRELTFENLLGIRNKSNAKYFRRWINDRSETGDAIEITREYLNEIKGSSKFFQSTGGRFIRGATMFGVGTALESVLAGTGALLADAALSSLDEYWLDSLLNGRNPSMFIDDIIIEKVKNEPID